MQPAASPLVNTTAPAGQPLIDRVLIRNFKSIDELTLNLGRITLLIGENGCGKTNLVEAIALGAASAANKLDNEFLASRGVRVADSSLMRAAFAVSSSTPIHVEFGAIGGALFSTTLRHDDRPYSRWEDETIQSLTAKVRGLLESRDQPDGELQRLFVALPSELRERALTDLVPALERVASEGLKWPGVPRFLPSFLIYAPQVTVLRALEVDSKIEPLGIHGEGLFKLLQTLEQEGRLAEVKENLRIIDWFDDLEIVGSGPPTERAIRFRDRFMDPSAPLLDQSTANEGFLYLLFYTCLLMSPYTPRFFAVDNLDSGLNPKLAARLFATIAALAKKYDKQAILTTHNPAVLDGLSLDDDEQRLLVVYRNVEGRTRVRRVTRADLPSGTAPARLSEAFLRGYLGGLPNF